MKKLQQATDTFTLKETEILGIVDPDPDVAFTLRPITREVLRGIYAQNTKKIPDPRTHRMVDDLNSEGVDADCLDYAVVAWTGLVINGEPAPCTRDLKLNGLDVSQQRGILERCMIARRDEVARSESFRATAAVGGVVDGTRPDDALLPNG